MQLIQAINYPLKQTTTELQSKKQCNYPPSQNCTFSHIKFSFSPAIKIKLFFHSPGSSDAIELCVSNVLQFKTVLKRSCEKWIMCEVQMRFVLSHEIQFTLVQLTTEHKNDDKWQNKSISFSWGLGKVFRVFNFEGLRAFIGNKRETREIYFNLKWLRIKKTTFLFSFFSENFIFIAKF